MATRAKWIERVEQWERSGLGAAEFALREGLNPTQFERWCQELRASLAPLAEPQRQARLAKPSGMALAAPATPPAPAWIDIALPDGGLVRLRPGVDAATLASVLAAAAELGSRRRR
jgi:hypothetical protein